MLVVFDVDGVLVDIDSSWGKVLKQLDIQGSPNMPFYLRGEIGYYEFMLKDIDLWKSKKKEVDIYFIKDVLSNVRIHPKAKNVVDELKKRGHEIALLSSGISILVENVAKLLDIKYYLANDLTVDDQGKIVGGISRVPLLDKHLVLKLWAKRLGYGLNSIVYVGDSVFDIPVFRIVKVPIAVVDNTFLETKMKKYVLYVIKKSKLEEILEIPELRG